jgi:ribonuclease R
MVVRLELTAEGKIVDEGCAAAIIKSKGRLDYAGVAAALQGNFQGKRQEYRQHRELLVNLSRIASTLRQRRIRRGSMDLNLPDPQVLLDADDPRLVRAIRESRLQPEIKQAYNLVEELMIAANEAVARIFQRAYLPTIWRVHPPPQAQALEELTSWLASYGVKAEAKALRTEKGMARIVRQLEGHPAARPLSYLILRTLKQATYQVDNVGHFGLASPAYLHFTSPIRRYPDLHVHRLLKLLLRDQGQPSGRMMKTQQITVEQLLCIAQESTANERRAIEIEREIQKIYSCSLMRDHIGEKSSGTITGIAPFGLFVTLEDPYVEGLIKADGLGQPVTFDEQALRLSSASTIFALGDRIDVKILDSSVARRQIDLNWALAPESRKGASRRRRNQEAPLAKEEKGRRRGPLARSPRDKTTHHRRRGRRR